MGANMLLRSISVLTFLLLVAPFYDHCNGQRMKMKEERRVEVVTFDSLALDSTRVNPVREQIQSSLKTKSPDENLLETLFKEIDDPDSESAFEMAKLGTDFIVMVFTDLDAGDWDEFLAQSFSKKIGTIAFYSQLLAFVFIVPLCLLCAILSFTRFRKTHCRFLAALSIFIAIAVLSLAFDRLLEDIRQIKWGYYVFVILILTQCCLLKEIRKAARKP